MEVVLRQDVDKLGLRGEVVNVARGYARNFLLPRGLAEPASPALVRELEKRDAQRARHEAKSVDEARAIAARLEAQSLRFDVNAGPTGTLFGSVTATRREMSFGVHPTPESCCITSTPSVKCPPPRRSSAPAFFAAVSWVERSVTLVG